MKKRFSRVLTASVVASLCAGSALAASYIVDSNTATTTYTAKYIAYEVYDNASGNNADQVPFYFLHDGTFNTDNQINLKGNNAKFNVSDQIFLLAKTSDLQTVTTAGVTTAVSTAANTNGCSVALTEITVTDAAGATANYVVVADGAQSAQPVDEITTKIHKLADFCSRNTGSAVLAGGNAASDVLRVKTGARYTTAYGALATTGQLVANPNGKGVVNLRVVGGLAPTCDTTKDIKLGVITNQGNILDKTVLTIQPQFKAVVGTGMQKELSTDDDFKKFIINGAAVGTYNTTIGSTGDLFVLMDRNGATGDLTGKYKAAVPTGSTATLSFTLASVSAETGATVKITDPAAAQTTCTAAADSKGFACAPANTTVAALDAATSYTVNVANTATVEMLPTNWTFSAFTFGITGYTTCIDLKNQSVGNWYGGIEAIVPIVKSDSNYSTFIKLFNRYSKGAKVYVANMNQVSDSIVTSINTLPAPNDVIASKGAITISGADLVNANVLTAAEAAFGAPVKFLVRVPSQDGGFTTGSFVGGTTGGTATIATGNIANVAKYSNVDPYLTGIVVQTFTGGQRSIPLMFKSYKQGQYN